MILTGQVLNALKYIEGLTPTQKLAGVTAKVVDGDTIKVRDADGNLHRIRFSGIDCPEKAQRPYGQIATAELSAMIAGKRVEVYWYKFDRYKRKVGKVTLAGVDVAVRLIRTGSCYVFRRYARELDPNDLSAYLAAEAEAKASRLGVWDPAARLAPPWEFRKKKRLTKR